MEILNVEEEILLQMSQEKLDIEMIRRLHKDYFKYLMEKKRMKLQGIIMPMIMGTEPVNNEMIKEFENLTKILKCGKQ